MDLDINIVYLCKLSNSYETMRYIYPLAPMGYLANECKLYLWLEQDSNDNSFIEESEVRDKAGTTRKGVKQLTGTATIIQATNFKMYDDTAPLFIGRHVTEENKYGFKDVLWYGDGKWRKVPEIGVVNESHERVFIKGSAKGSCDFLPSIFSTPLFQRSESFEFTYSIDFGPPSIRPDLSSIILSLLSRGHSLKMFPTSWHLLHLNETPS